MPTAVDPQRATCLNMSSRCSEDLRCRLSISKTYRRPFVASAIVAITVGSFGLLQALLPGQLAYISGIPCTSLITAGSWMSTLISFDELSGRDSGATLTHIFFPSYSDQPCRWLLNDRYPFRISSLVCLCGHVGLPTLTNVPSSSRLSAIPTFIVWNRNALA